MIKSYSILRKKMNPGAGKKAVEKTKITVHKIAVSLTKNRQKIFIFQAIFAFYATNDTD